MRYMLMFYANEAEGAKIDPERMEVAMAQFTAFGEALQKAGAAVPDGMRRLRPTTAATTVRVVDGKAEVLDGPYAETKEQLGGYVIIDVADLDSALQWAARCPAATWGSVEVRPYWSNSTG